MSVGYMDMRAMLQHTSSLLPASKFSVTPIILKSHDYYIVSKNSTLCDNTIAGMKTGSFRVSPAL